MKNLMDTNCFDTKEEILIYGKCLENMHPLAYKKLVEMYPDAYEICLEKEHMNMAFTKIITMLSIGKIKKVVFATVDKSPHCVQLHYISKELTRFEGLPKFVMQNYVVVDNNLVEIDQEIISLSKNLSKIKDTIYKK